MQHHEEDPDWFWRKMGIMDPLSIDTEPVTEKEKGTGKEEKYNTRKYTPYDEEDFRERMEHRVHHMVHSKQPSIALCDLNLSLIHI